MPHKSHSKRPVVVVEVPVPSIKPRTIIRPAEPQGSYSQFINSAFQLH